MSGSKDSIYAQLLALRCRQGDMGAFEHLVRLWEARLFYYIRRLVDQEADAWDVLQKTWIKALRGIRSLKDPEALPCWLYTLARRTVIDHLRRAPDRQLPEDFADESADPASADEPGLALDNEEAAPADALPGRTSRAWRRARARRRSPHRISQADACRAAARTLIAPSPCRGFSARCRARGTPAGQPTAARPASFGRFRRA